MNTSEHIHRFVPARASVEKAYTLLLLHGTGGDENNLMGLADHFGQAFNYLSPRGQVLENGMPRFFRRLSEGVFDQKDLEKRTRDLATFIRHAGTHYGFNPRKVIALGYSNGANIAASLMLSGENVLKHAILMHAMVPFIPSDFPLLQHSQVLLTAGENDPIVPAENTSALADLLVQAGAEVEIFWHQSGHTLIEEEIARAQLFLNNLNI
ncbi:MAG: alpha/beta hydrolase [Bacteroides sp.]|jgi:phospholipase/carboxylesterase/glyoxalase family protein|nr:alpha/beta hydrolase [Bacteroides sp.]